MFLTIRFLLTSLIIATLLTWILDREGSVIINWLGYEVKTGILTAILITIFFAWLIFSLSYIATKVITKRNFRKKLAKLKLNQPSE